jgi:hypothetical protein
MEECDLGKHQPSCLLAHGLLNQLTIIIGYCDLITEATTEEAQRAERLASIRQLAATMAGTLRNHQCQPEAMAKMVAKHLQMLKWQ